jgi:hypothetical protein
LDQVSGYGSGFGIQIRIQEGKNELQKQKQIKKFHVLRCWNPDPYPVGQKLTTKAETNKEISCFEVLDTLF